MTDSSDIAIDSIRKAVHKKNPFIICREVRAFARTWAAVREAERAHCRASGELRRKVARGQLGDGIYEVGPEIVIINDDELDANGERIIELHCTIGEGYE